MAPPPTWAVALICALNASAMLVVAASWFSRRHGSTGLLKTAFFMNLASCLWNSFVLFSRA